MEKRPTAVVTMVLEKSQLERLKEHCDVIQTGWGTTGALMSEEALINAVKDADIFLVGYEEVPAKVIESAKNMKLIACARGNPVNIDVDAANRGGIPLLYTPGRNSNSAAEFTFGLLLSEVRHIGRAFHSLKSGEYLGEPKDSFVGAPDREDVVWTLSGDSPYKRFRGIELEDRTLGLVGLGAIGLKVARIAHGFDMRVISYDPYCPVERAVDAGVELVSLDELLQQSDFISIHCKVSAETKGLIGKREFDLMKSNAYIINTARAIVIQQEALIEALREKRIRGAALDVYWDEPLPSNHPLLSFDNVTLTPHLGGASDDVPLRHSRMIVDDVLAWLAGERPERVYNPQVFA